MADSTNRIVSEIKKKIFALDLEGGIQLFLEYLQKDPNREGLYIIRNFIAPHLYCRKIDLDKLFENCYMAVHSNPKNSGAWALLGLAYKSQEKYEQALECFLKAFLCTPTLSNLIDIAFVYRNLGMLDESAKLIFSKELFLRYFVSKKDMLVKYQIVDQWQLSMALTFVDLKAPNEEIVRKIVGSNSRLLLLYFIMDEHQLNGDTGRKLVNLFESIEGRGIVFRVVHTLPICIFGVEHDKIFSRYGIPTSCRLCAYSCVVKKKSYVELCGRKKFDNKFVLNSLQEGLEKKHITKATPQICANCQYYLKGICTGLCSKSNC